MNANGKRAGTAVLCDAQGRVIRVLRDDLGCAGELPPGAMLVALFDGDSAEKALQFFQTARSRNAAFGWELCGCIGGNTTVLRCAGVSLDERVVAILEDAETGLGTLPEELMRMNNEAVNLQRELSRKSAELERLDALKNQFLGMAAHDLRNPLGLILGYSAFLAEECAVPEERTFAAVIQQQAKAMIALVDDLLDISRIESGKLELRREPIDLAALVNGCCAVHQVLAGKRRMVIRFEAPPGAVLVSADSRRLEQVLNNLLSNAIKFSPDQATVRVRLLDQDENVVVAVEDCGPGIPAGEMDKLFRPFSRTTVEPAAGERSTGLGLAISRRIVQAHGGKIWAESHVGRGSIFYVALTKAC